MGGETNPSTYQKTSCSVTNAEREISGFLNDNIRN